MPPVTGRSLTAVVPGVGGRGSAVRSPAAAPLTPHRGWLPTAHRHRCLLGAYVFLPAPLLFVDVPVVLCPETPRKSVLKICNKMKGIFTYFFSLTRANKKNNRIKLRRFAFTLEIKIHLMRLHVRRNGFTVADPGFPRRRAPTPEGFAKTIYYALVKILPKTA